MKKEKMSQSTLTEAQLYGTVLDDGKIVLEDGRMATLTEARVLYHAKKRSAKQAMKAAKVAASTAEVVS